MGRARHISKEAKRTTVALTPLQQLAVQELTIKRLKEGSPKPLLNEIIVDGLQELLRKEGWSETDLGRIFPKPETQRAKVHTLRKHRNSPSA